MKSCEKLEKVGKSVEKLEKVGKNGEKLEKVGKDGERWGKVFFFLFLNKMAAGGHFGCHFRLIRNHFGLDDNASYRTRPRYLDE